MYEVNSEELQENCRRIVEALEANKCLREFHIKALGNHPGPPDLSIFIEHYCRNETLSEVTITPSNVGIGELHAIMCFLDPFNTLLAFISGGEAGEASPPQQNVFPPGLSPSMQYCLT